MSDLKVINGTIGQLVDNIKERYPMDQVIVHTDVDPEAPLADHIDAAGGVSILAASIIERQKRQAERAQPVTVDLTGFIAAEDRIADLADELEAMEFVPDPGDTLLDAARKGFLESTLPQWYGQPNPNFIRKERLNEDGPQFTFSNGVRKGQVGYSTTEMLVAVWVGGKTPTVVYFLDTDPQRELSDFPEWEAVALREFRTAAECGRFLRDHRIGMTPEDRQRQEKNLRTVQDALRKVSGESYEEDPADADGDEQ